MRIAAAIVAICCLFMLIALAALLARAHQRGCVEIEESGLRVYWSDPAPGRIGIAPPAHYFTVSFTELAGMICVLGALPGVLVVEWLVRQFRRPQT